MYCSASFPTMYQIGLIFLLTLSGTKSQRFTWTAEDLPHPNANKKDCGLIGETERDGFICDPNYLLADDHRIQINWKLDDIARDGTPCPCSTWFCETSARPMKGYKVYVALVKKMTIQSGTEEEQVTAGGQAQLMAHELQSEHWKEGSCGENIVVLFSEDDRTLMIQAGPTAAIKLNDYNRRLIAYKASAYFRKKQYIQALNVLLNDMKIILNCPSNAPGACPLNEYRSSAVSVTTCVPLLSLLLAFSFSKYIF